MKVNELYFFELMLKPNKSEGDKQWIIAICSSLYLADFLNDIRTKPEYAENLINEIKKLENKNEEVNNENS